MTTLKGSAQHALATPRQLTVRPITLALPKDSFSFEPTWSPGGRRIAFVHATRTRTPHIWTMTRDGKRLRQVTHGPRPDVRPDWGSR